MTVDVECNHDGPYYRAGSWDPRRYCRVCWAVKRWAEWFDLLADLRGDDE